MAQELINVGTAPNDGSGDTLRASQIKANNNFTELYGLLAASVPLNALEVRVFKKAAGNIGGLTKEVGDWVYGEPTPGVYWVWAIVGADPNDYNTYEVKSILE